MKKANKFSKIALSFIKKNIKCRIMRIFNVYGKGENKKIIMSLSYANKTKFHLQLTQAIKRKILSKLEGSKYFD